MYDFYDYMDIDEKAENNQPEEWMYQDGTNVEVLMKDGTKYEEDFIGGLQSRDDYAFAFKKICCDYDIDPTQVKEVTYTDVGYQQQPSGWYTWQKSNPDNRAVFEAWGNHYLTGVMSF